MSASGGTRRIAAGGSGGHALRVRTTGEGQRHLLCLHGLADTLEIWDRIEPELSARGRVCCVEQRGHGESAAPPGPYARLDLARDVVAVLDAEGVERTILVGHSMGGVVAMAAALEAPERIAGLVLIGSTSRCSEKVTRWYERIARAGETDGTAGLARNIYGEESGRRIRGDAQGISHATRMLKSLYEDPLTPKLADVACPVLLMVGEKDLMGPRASEHIHAALPDGRSELVVLPARGHWLHVEAVDEVIAALDPWLAKHAL